MRKQTNKVGKQHKQKKSLRKKRHFFETTSILLIIFKLSSAVVDLLKRFHLL
jgi:hypothetical protein